MIIEILGTRVLGPFFGLGVQVWAALITVTLTALALGYWLGGAVADRRPSPVLFHAIILFAGIATALVRWVAGPVMDVFSGLGVEAGALFSALVIFGPALFFMGALTPCAVRLHPARATRTGGTVGRLYAVSTVGSVAGALLAAYVLLPRLPISRIFDATALLLGLTAIAGLLLLRRRLALAGGALLLCCVVPERGDRQAGAGVELVRDEQTFCNRIQTIDAYGERLLLLDGLIHTHTSTSFPEDPVQCEYVRTAELVPAVRPDARRYLVIGCGGGAMLRLLAGEGRTFDVVDIDPGVIRAAKEDFGADVPGATFHAGDARMFIRRNETWDAVLLDVVSTEVMPEHLCTIEFLRELKGRLTPGGVIMMNSIGRPGGRVLDSFGRTLRAAFAHVLAFAAHAEPDSTNVLWLASDAEVRLPEEQRFIYEDRCYPTGDAGIVLRDDFNPVNHWNASVGLALRRKHHLQFGRELFEVR